MVEPTSRGIQATLFDYFQDTEYFDLQEANELLLEHQQRDINAESIRARIYEGIDKGLFERVGKGLYTVTRKDEHGNENTCLLINGDGRDLSFLPDNSVDSIITDHPYQLTASLKGGNRNFADYELFQYTEKDMTEKFRVLKPGCFLIEFLPEENAENYQYLYKVKELARKAGLEYYSKISWKKGDFVANTGRKSKNTEDVLFFTKGRARNLRPDAKKDKQYAASREIVTYKEYLPGSTTVHASEMGGMGTSYETRLDPVDVNIHISVDRKDATWAKELLEEAFDNKMYLFIDDSPLDLDNGGAYTLEELDKMPAQEYILRYLESKGLSFVDLSPGPEDIFRANTSVLVNPTNLIGPMGAGLAKEFKEKYPGLEDLYKESCRQRKHCSGVSQDGFKSLSGGGDEILIGESLAMFEGNLFLWRGNPSQSHPAVLCFPTKHHWKDHASLDLIESGLKTFARNYKHCNISSITFPKLGCGLGGLDWEKEVKPLMQKYLSGLPDLDVQICGDTLREDRQEHFMSGAKGMLPTVFDVPGPPKKEKIHQAEKPVALLEQILRFVTKEDELVWDQFAGSGSLGEAAFKTGRNSVLIEKDVETFQKLTQRLQVLGQIKAVTSAQRDVISIGSDALVAKDAYYRTGNDRIVTDFVETHDIKPKELHAAHIDMHLDEAPGVCLSKEEKLAIASAMDAVKYLDFKAGSLKKTQKSAITPDEASAKQDTDTQAPKVLECSSRGDRRFSALFAKVTIKGKKQSIEEWYQNAKRTADGKKAGKGKPFDHILCPYTGAKLPASEATWLYRGLWIAYLSKHPELVEYADQFDEFHDMFKRNGIENGQAEVIEAYVKGDRARYVDVVRASRWYQNLAAKSKKPSLNTILHDATVRSEEQTSLFGEISQTRHHWDIPR